MTTSRPALALVAFAALVMLATACGGAASRVMAPGVYGNQAAPAKAANPAEPPGPDVALMVEGSVSVRVEDVTAATASIRERIRTAGGRIVSERESGAGLSWSGSLKVRVPPAAVTPLIELLDKLGDITNKRIDATDVSKTLFDQDIALKNLQTTLERMRALLQSADLKMEDILNIEKEMTRLRGEIERIKGEQRFLKDRVAFATLDIILSREQGAVLSPTAKLYPGPRLSSLILLRPNDRQRVRFGGGATIHLGIPRLSLEVDGFAAPDDETDPSVIATIGASMYSDFLGRGRRKMFNPYIGLRAGYGYLQDSRFVAAADIGVELFKTERFMIDANIRATALLGETSDIAIVPGLSAVFAF